jgi:hypothetical protein
MLRKIISGGQTGADRGGLQAGKKLGLETGGTAPRGFRTENGPDPSLAGFGLAEHRSAHFGPRTVRNVEDSDGTVWFGLTDTRGALLTLKTAIRLDRPLLLNPLPGALLEWIEKNRIAVLNVAGNRESLHPGLCRQVEEFLVGELRTRATPGLF